METKRMRFDENFSLERAQRMLDLKIYQNQIIAQCLDDNYINRLLESTRTLISDDLSQEEDRLIHHFQNQQRVENEAIEASINRFGLQATCSHKNQPIYSDEDSSADELIQLPTTSSSPSTSSALDQNSSFEDVAINSAISSYGLRKN